MKKYVIISYLMFLSLVCVAAVPNYSEKLGGYILNSEIYRGDTIGSVVLPEVPIYPAPKFKNKSKQRWSICRRFKSFYLFNHRRK
jgi:hypothetical protein